MLPDDYTPLSDYNEIIKKNAIDFYRAAYNNHGDTSLNEMYKILYTKINSDNITDFLDAYNSKEIRRGDSSIIDTVVSEISGSKEEKKKILNSLMTTLCMAAREVHVSSEDIQKAKQDFTSSLNKELNSFGKMNPCDMEKAVDFLRGAIAVRYNLDKYDTAEDKDIIKNFNAALITEHETALQKFKSDEKYNNLGRKIYDKIPGWFGCKTIDEIEKKLGDNSNAVKKLINSATEEEFKENYKEIFGIEFDRNKITERDTAIRNYIIAKNNSDLIQKINNIIETDKSYNEIKDILINDFHQSEESIDSIIYKNIEKPEQGIITEEEKKAALIKFLKFNNKVLKKYYINELRGKSLEQLKQDIELITKSAFGTNDIVKDINQL